MADVGRLSAALTIDGAEQFQAKLASVGKTFTDAGNKGRSFGQAGAEAFKVAAGATTALATAAGAYLTVLTKTGVQYNSLQQNSRAALSVMLGGAEKANAQMDKLDAFARNSPFSKSVFIDAQQQLLGFGVEAQKVIPYMDALQNAVAATGGGNAQLDGLVQIMAKIQSSAKITAVDLMQFGNRGVDAAALIGSQMGKTAAQIREEITNGTLDATVALDALAAGMQTKFGGTTELVKQQWSGAVDRVIAANRDLGAAIAEPFVSKNGGGMAVTWGNQVADVLRAIERQATPVMGVLTRMGQPLFDGLTASLDKAAASINRFNPERVSDGLEKMKGHAPGIAALAGAVLAVGASVGPLGQMFKVLGVTVNPVVAAFAGLVAASPELRSAMGDLLAAGQPLVPLLGEVAALASGALSAALPVVADGISLVAKVATPLVDILAKIPAPVLLSVTAFLGLQRALGPLNGALTAAGTAMKVFGERAAVQAALGGTSAGVGALSAASMSAKGAVAGLGNALKAAFVTNPAGLAIAAVSGAVALWAGANAEAEKKVKEHNDRVMTLKGTMSDSTGAITEATAAQVAANLEQTRAGQLAAEMGIKMSDVQKAVLGNAKSQELISQQMTEHWEENAVTLDKSNDALNTWSATATNARNRQRELSEIVAEQTAAIEDAKQAKADMIRIERENNAAMSEGERAQRRFADALDVARDSTADLATRVSALRQALDELRGGSITAEEATKRFNAANLDLAEGLAQTGENGEKLWQATLNGAGAIDTSTRAGIAFSDTMSSMRDRLLEAAIVASDSAMKNNDLEGAIAAATAAAKGQQDSMRATMEAAGLEQGQIDALIDSMGSVPEVVATALTTEGYSIVDAQLIGLIAELDTLEEGAVITVTEPMSPVVKKRLQDLGYEVKTMPDKTITIRSTGEDNIRRVISELTAPSSKTITLLYGVGNEPQLGPLKAPGKMNGGMESGPVQAFNNGGLPSGYYSAPAGRPALYKFAEQNLPWEVFISPQPGKERENAGYALDALQRLGFPSVPISALGGSPGAIQRAGGSLPMAMVDSAAASARPVGDIKIYGHRGMDIDAIADAVYGIISGRM
ncbi:tape measure protein [Pseudomonas sp.]|uniref:tape measure protein n=1 Tax=Pseudomonas sp. TaxID=306 RepID=UPI00260B04E5|nr:tape measure protein [Pseudomonas sp.]